MTVAEFDRLAEAEAFAQELHQGELVRVTRPKLNHVFAQKCLVRLLDAASAGGAAFTKVGFRPLPEYELRVADVAWASLATWEREDPGGHFRGVPELVIEVLSPSNTAAEMLDKKTLCLANGAREFWQVDLEHRVVEVSTSEGRATVYGAGAAIPLFFAGGATLAVDNIFSAAPA
jgi:Uma2 family endonuclease